MEIDCPLTMASPGLLTGSAVATLTSTGVCQDQTTGAVYLSMVMTSMELMNLEAPLQAVGHQRLTLKELTDADLADGHPK